MTEKNTAGVWPCLLYDDAEEARAFLTDVFGFIEALTVRGADDNTIVHGELRWPEGGGVMFGSTRGDGHDAVPTPGGVQWLYVVTDDPDAVHRRAEDAGARIVMEPYDADYGSRNVAIADPRGNVWTFGTYRGS